MMTSPRCLLRDAFTLIELLAVVAIIAILAALLLPAANSMIQKGREAKCVANLRQIGAGLASFAASYDGNLPLGTAQNDTQILNRGDITGATTGVGWARCLQAHMVASDSINANRWATVFMCPSARDTSGYTKANSANTGGYGLNTGLANQNTGTPIGTPVGYSIKTLKIQRPSATLLAADWPGPTLPPMTPSSNFKTQAERLSKRHGGRLNVLYADGHVGSMSISDLIEVQKKGQNDPDFKTLFLGQ